MTAVNCPMCELRFPSRNERDWHLRNEHEHLHVHRPADRSDIWWRQSSRPGQQEPVPTEPAETQPAPTEPARGRRRRR